MKLFLQSFLICIAGALIASPQLNAQEKQTGKLNYISKASPGNPSAYILGLVSKPYSKIPGLVSKNARIIKSGKRICFAIDGATKDASGKDLNLLKIDLSGKPDFTNAKSIPITFKKRGKFITASANSNKIVTTLNGKQIAISLEFSIHMDQNFTIASRRPRMKFSAAAKGKVKLDGETFDIKAIDNTGNLTFNKKLKLPVVSKYDIDKCDFYYLSDAKNNSIKIRPQMPFKFKGKWWTINVDKDLNISAKKFTGSLAKVKMRGKFWSGILSGKKYLIIVPMSKGEIEIPADEYYVLQYKVVHGDNPKAFGPLVNGYNIRGLKKSVIVQAGKTTVIPVGDSIIVGSTVRFEKGKLILKVKLNDALGTNTVKPVGVGGRRYPAPKLEIFDSAGKLIYKHNLHYG